jgi:adenosylcobinamide-phosphate synthase
MLWNVAVLYTLGFRQFSHHFTRIRDALDAGDEHAARERWPTGSRWMPASCRAAKWCAMSSSIRCWRAPPCVWRAVLVLVLSALGLGPAGAVLYRMAEYLSRYWSRKVDCRGASGQRAPAAGCARRLAGSTGCRRG